MKNIMKSKNHNACLQGEKHPSDRSRSRHRLQDRQNRPAGS